MQWHLAASLTLTQTEIHHFLSLHCVYLLRFLSIFESRCLILSQIKYIQNFHDTLTAPADVFMNMYLKAAKLIQ